MEKQREDDIKQFMELTNADEERARFFLESSGWNLTVAISTFLDEDASTMSGFQQSPHQPMRKQEENAEEMSVSDTDEEFTPTTIAKEEEKSKKSYDLRSTGGTRIATLRHSESSSDEENQAFFVGGGERSGQQVLGPPRKDKKKPGEIVQDLFKSAKEHGAEVVDPSTARRSQGSYFGGTGYRLGQTVDDTEVVASAPSPPKPKVVVLRLWKNGFSLDDGPLRSYDEPANRLFLQSIKQGEVPMELVREAKGGKVHLDMDDCRDRDYAPVKSKFKSFAGQGHMLGSPAPVFSGEGGTSAGGATAFPPLVDDLKACEAKAAASLNMDSCQPVTNIQIRFEDGSRLVGRFNQDHTIADVRRYIQIARPAFEVTPFSLIGGIPSKMITDESRSLKDLDLVGSSLMVRNK